MGRIFYEWLSVDNHGAEKKPLDNHGSDLTNGWVVCSNRREGTVEHWVPIDKISNSARTSVTGAFQRLLCKLPLHATNHINSTPSYTSNRTIYSY